jgi:hypothetical protein
MRVESLSRLKNYFIYNFPSPSLLERLSVNCSHPPFHPNLLGSLPLPLIYTSQIAIMLPSPSLSSGAVLVCLSLLTQPILAQMYSNSSMTITASSSTPTNGTTTTNPAYGGWAYYGCVTSKDGFPGFTPVKVVDVDAEKCTAACQVSYRYAALLEEYVTYNLTT